MHVFLQFYLYRSRAPTSSWACSSLSCRVVASSAMYALAQIGHDSYTQVAQCPPPPPGKPLSRYHSIITLPCKVRECLLAIRGLVKFKKTRIGQTNTPRYNLNLLFFEEKHENNTKNTKRHKISQKKNPSWCLTHPLPSFSRIFKKKFTLTRPLTAFSFWHNSTEVLPGSQTFFKRAANTAD